MVSQIFSIKIVISEFICIEFLLNVHTSAEKYVFFQLEFMKCPYAENDFLILKVSDCLELLQMGLT